MSKNKIDILLFEIDIHLYTWYNIDVNIIMGVLLCLKL